MDFTLIREHSNIEHRFLLGPFVTVEGRFSTFGSEAITRQGFENFPVLMVDTLNIGSHFCFGIDRYKD